MATYVSPGVYTAERDNSVYVSDLSTTLAAIVGTAEKGPTNTPTLVTSAKQFVDIFGTLNPKHYMSYAAIAYLQKGSRLWVTRVAAQDAKKAQVTFPVPSGYQTFNGAWTLAAVDNIANTVTLSLANNPTDTSTTKTVKLATDTHLPNFLFNDPTELLFANTAVGADLDTLTGSSFKKYAIGQTFGITLGPGKDHSAVISNIVSNTVPQVVLPSSSFPTANSPATAAPIGVISGLASTPADAADLFVLASNGTKKLKVVSSIIATEGALDTLITNLSSVVSATQLTALETLVSAEAANVTSLSWPIVGSAASKTLHAFNLVLEGLLTVVSGSTAPLVGSYPHLNAFYATYKAVSGSTTIGVGLFNGTTGVGQGYSSVDETLSGTSVTAIRLTGLVSGLNGVFTYSTQTPAPALSVVLQDMVISGNFTTSMHRPIWKKTSSGTSKIATFLKVYGLGECDLSNVCVTLGLTEGSVDSTGEQLYTLKVYERLVSDSISVTSYKAQDFTVVEQYVGTLDVIKSSVKASSRKISVKIDYTVADTYTYSTDSVVLNATTPEQLSVSPVMYSEPLGTDVIVGSVVLADSSSNLYNTFTNELVGGSIGSTVTDEDIIGTVAAKTGLNSFANPEEIDMNILMVPGRSASPAVAKAMISLCESRGDAMAVIDTPYALTPQEAIAFRKNVLNVSNSYGAVYYPWIKITDAVNKKDIFTPPSGYVVAQYAFNDQVADVHYAPAGRNRGTILDALATEVILTQGDRDALALSQINPIHSEAGYGIYIKGQYTLQATPSALDRVNVRRLLLQLRKIVATASKAFEFEPNDAVSAYRLKQIIESVLNDRVRKGAISSFKVDVGPGVNTNYVKENSELRAEISIIPTKSAEKIVEIFNILPQGGITVIQ